jgi:hypothetical protein
MGPECRRTAGYFFKDSTEEVRGSCETQAQIESVPKGRGTKGKPVVGIRRIVAGDGRINLKNEQTRVVVMGTLQIK